MFFHPRCMPLRPALRVVGIRTSVYAAANAVNLPTPFARGLSIPMRDDSLLKKPEFLEKPERKLRVLFFTNAHNSMSQAFHIELEQRGYQVLLHVAEGEKDMLSAHDIFAPDVIVAPFLTKRIPESLWRKNDRCPVLVVHPGIRGDRGMSSIDWALKDGVKEWGVTVLQADKEMDAGDVWHSENFKVSHSPDMTKSTMYSKLCVPAALTGIKAAIDKIIRGERPRPLNYSDPDTKGSLQPNMKRSDRFLDWEERSAAEVARTVLFSDSRPGTRHTVLGSRVLLFGVHPEGERVDVRGAKPGDPVAQRDGAVLFQCSGQRGVWISQMRRDSKGSLKLPATSALPREEVDRFLPVLQPPSLYVPFGERPQTFQEVWVSVKDGIAHVHANFYNGAMSTEQCKRLERAIVEVGGREDVKIVLILGGYSFYGNGINLNVIEASDNPEQESWRNINAINDMIRATFSIRDQAVISVMRGNAGAGGAMAALAADRVWAHESIVLNPHYKDMELSGSEYWTYFLPKKVGLAMAEHLTNTLEPISASQAKSHGMVNKLLHYSPSLTFAEEAGHIQTLAKSVLDSGEADRIVTAKRVERDADWFAKVESFREAELLRMGECFASPWYDEVRRRFVYKAKSLSTTPPHMTLKPGIPAQLLDGRAAAKALNSTLALHVEELEKIYGRAPGLGIIMANGRLDSSIYVNGKVKAAQAVGIKPTVLDIASKGVAPKEIERRVLTEVARLNADDTVDGIVVQMPLPKGVDTSLIEASVDPDKDVDACHPQHLANVYQAGNWAKPTDSAAPGEFRPIAGTPRGIAMLLAMHGVRVLGKSVVVVGKGHMVGLPLSLLLSKGGATVTMCDVHTKRATLEESVRKADIMISAAGKAGLIKGEWIKRGAVVVDVAMNAVGTKANGKRILVGDVEAEVAKTRASLISPVPGGVGPMTIAFLLQTTVESFEARQMRIQLRKEREEEEEYEEGEEEEGGGGVGGSRS